MKKEISNVEDLQNKIDSVKENTKFEYTWTFKDVSNIEDVIRENESLKEKIKDYERIELMYKNLRINFNKVVSEVLGDDYYNYGMDTYNCDRLTCEDLIRAKVKVLFRRK